MMSLRGIASRFNQEDGTERPRFSGPVALYESEKSLTDIGTNLKW